MAITRPDEYQHNNPNLAIADSDNIRGSTKTVSDQAAMLAIPADKLKLYSRVRYKEGGQTKEWELNNISDPSSISNWTDITNNGVSITDDETSTSTETVPSSLALSKVNTKSRYFSVVDLGDVTGTVNLDWNLAIKFKMNLTGNVTFTYSNLEEETKIQGLEITSSSPTNTITWGSQVDLTEFDLNPIDFSTTTTKNFISMRYLGNLSGIDFQVANLVR